MEHFSFTRSIYKDRDIVAERVKQLKQELEHAEATLEMLDHVAGTLKPQLRLEGRERTKK